MSARKKIIPGARYNRWTIIEEIESQRDSTNKPYRTFKVKCFCGVEKTLRINHLLSGKSKSCGCLRAEVTARKNTTHGLKYTRLNNIWNGIKQRCNNSHHPRFKDYGGRGIKVYEQWKNDFKAFYNWAMANGYSLELSIDRIDNNRGYEPSNCRWATALEQRLNQRRAIA